MDSGAFYRGHCQCGGVGFAIRAPTLFCSHCHCDYCRRSHGAAYVTWVGCDETRLALTRGATLLRWYRSSNSGSRAFCRRCGSRLFFRSRLCPNEIHVVRTAIDGAIDRLPEQHDFHDQRPEWGAGDAHLPRFDSDYEALERYRRVPKYRTTAPSGEGAMAQQ